MGVCLFSEGVYPGLKANQKESHPLGVPHTDKAKASYRAVIGVCALALAVETREDFQPSQNSFLDKGPGSRWMLSS